ncbi:MAG: transporter related [Bryobacterales bacterium]|nr:transporter related [Bryobacterales bacterium]
MTPIVEFANVAYEIAGKRILQNFSLAIEPGETLILLGRSGSGKTTALKLVNGLLFPTSGEVLVEGRPTTAWNPVELKRRIGYVIQEAGLFPHFTVEKNVALPPRLAGWPPDKISARVAEMLTRVGLADYAARYPRSLSGGQRQRVGVARALAADPPILLLDEPFGALDPVTRLDLQRQFRELRKTLNTTAIFVTHDVREALALGSRIALLLDGKLDVLATPAGFQRADTPEAKAFLEVLQDVG